MESYLSSVKILFFDIGNVFVSDDPSGCYCYEQLYETLGGQKALTPEEFFARREEHLRQGGSGLWSFVEATLPPGTDFLAFQRRVRSEIYCRWDHFSPAVTAMQQVPRKLAGRYRLGIIANQPRQIEDVLRARGLWQPFEVTAISESLGLSKPDPSIFQWALERAQVRPEQAMMIGDRIDNDIRPAKALSMRTLWLVFEPSARGWSPANAFQRCYAESLQNHSFSSLEPTCAEEQPDLIARSPEQLLRLLLGHDAEEGEALTQLPLPPCQSVE